MLFSIHYTVISLPNPCTSPYKLLFPPYRSNLPQTRDQEYTGSRFREIWQYHYGTPIDTPHVDSDVLIDLRCRYTRCPPCHTFMVLALLTTVYDLLNSRSVGANTPSYLLLSPIAPAKAATPFLWYMPWLSLQLGWHSPRLLPVPQQMFLAIWGHGRPVSVPVPAAIVLSESW